MPDHEWSKGFVGKANLRVAELRRERTAIRNIVYLCSLDFLGADENSDHLTVILHLGFRIKIIEVARPRILHN